MEDSPSVPSVLDREGTARRLPGSFALFSAAAAISAAGLGTFGVIGYALTDRDLVTVAVVPVVYAGAMLVEAVAALATGFAYDRVGARVLLVLPFLVAIVPALVFGARLAVVLAGVAVWGLATGVQDSTVKALVADLVPTGSLATAYGLFAVAQGAGALIGGVVAGAWYADHLDRLVTAAVATQAICLVLLVVTIARARRAARRDAKG